MELESEDVHPEVVKVVQQLADPQQARAMNKISILGKEIGAQV